MGPRDSRTGCSSLGLALALANGSVALASARSVAQTATVALTTDLNLSNYGQPVTLTASVNPPDASGTITFKDSLMVFATAPLSGGTGSIVRSTLRAGNHTRLTAAYSGDSVYAAATSPPYAQLVYAIATKDKNS